MAKKVIELTFDLDTKAVVGESSGYEGTACSLDLDPILAAIAPPGGVKKKRKERLQLRDTREKATR